MPKKQKPDNGLASPPQLMPIGKKSGKGKGWQKYLQSNAVKAGLAGVVVLLLVLVIGWQLMSGGGSGTKSIGTTASSDSNQAQSAPPSHQMPAETAQASPDQKDTSADQSAQKGQENKQGQSTEPQPETTQPEQRQPVRGAHGTTQETAPGAENSSAQPSCRRISPSGRKPTLFAHGRKTTPNYSKRWHIWARSFPAAYRKPKIWPIC